MTNVQVQFVKKSSNAKVGPIPTTTSDRSTCPDSCPLRGKGGCYAESGFYTRLNWDKIDARERGSNWQALCDNVKALPDGQVWRHNVAGDLPHDNGLIDSVALGQLTMANRGRKGFTYTHHDMRIPHNRLYVALYNSMGFTINLSANNIDHADELVSLGIAPVTVVLPADQEGNYLETPAGNRVVVCPAITNDDITCGGCQLCQKAHRKVVVGFPAHGSRKRAAESH